MDEVKREIKLNEQCSVRVNGQRQCNYFRADSHQMLSNVFLKDIENAYTVNFMFSNYSSAPHSFSSNTFQKSTVACILLH